MSVDVSRNRSGNGGVANRAVGRDWWDCEIYYLNRFGKVLMALVGKVSGTVGTGTHDVAAGSED